MNIQRGDEVLYYGISSIVTDVPIDLHNGKYLIPIHNTFDGHLEVTNEELNQNFERIENYV